MDHGPRLGALAMQSPARDDALVMGPPVKLQKNAA